MKDKIYFLLTRAQEEIILDGHIIDGWYSYPPGWWKKTEEPGVYEFGDYEDLPRKEAIEFLKEEINRLQTKLKEITDESNEGESIEQD